MNGEEKEEDEEEAEGGGGGADAMDIVCLDAAKMS